MTVEEALEIMEKESGWRFDPKLALIFMDLMRGGTVEIRGHKNTGEPVALDHVLAQIKQTNCSDR
jgi:HD-GYP domain-containing protein (c-di-GMP phosphodiesterase class II)